MYPVDPGEEFGRFVAIGDRQTDTYEPLPSRIDGSVTYTLWMFTKAEKEAIAEGAPLYLVITRPIGQPLQPIAIGVKGVVNEQA